MPGRMRITQPAQNYATGNTGWNKQGCPFPTARPLLDSAHSALPPACSALLPVGSELSSTPGHGQVPAEAPTEHYLSPPSPHSSAEGRTARWCQRDDAVTGNTESIGDLCAPLEVHGLDGRQTTNGDTFQTHSISQRINLQSATGPRNQIECTVY